LSVDWDNTAASVSYHGAQGPHLPELTPLFFYSRIEWSGYLHSTLNSLPLHSCFTLTPLSLHSFFPPRTHSTLLLRYSRIEWSGYLHSTLNSLPLHSCFTLTPLPLHSFFLPELTPLFFYSRIEWSGYLHSTLF